MPIRLRSLQLRFVFALVLTACLLATAAGVLAYRIGFSRALESGRANLQGLLLAIEKTAAVGVYASDSVLMREVVDGLARSPLAANVRITDAHGSVLVQTRQAGASLSVADVPAMEVRQTLASPFNTQETLGHLQITANAEVLQQSARSEALLLAKLMIGLIAILAAVVHVLARRLVSQPIEQLALSLKDMKPGTDQRLAVPVRHRHDEIGDLITSTNHLLQTNQLALGRERELRAHIEQMEAQYRNLFQSSSAGMFVLGLNGNWQLLHANQTMFRLLGFSAANSPSENGRFFRDAFAEQASLLELIQLARQTGQTASADLELTGSTMHQRWVHCLISIHRDAPGPSAQPSAGTSDESAMLVEGVLYDISDRKHAEGAIRHRAEHDPLTGLKNRASADASVDRLLVESQSEGTPFSVMYLDLDGFKQVNDHHGHKVGDQVLIECARRMRQVIRRGSDLCARIGGDEFLVALPGTAPHDPHVCEVASGLVESLGQPFALDDGTQVRIGASVGIACYPKHGHNRKELLHMADLALYEVKRTGRNSFAMAFRADLVTEPDPAPRQPPV